MDLSMMSAGYFPFHFRCTNGEMHPRPFLVGFLGCSAGGFCWEVFENVLDRFDPRPSHSQ